MGSGSEEDGKLVVLLYNNFPYLDSGFSLFLAFEEWFLYYLTVVLFDTCNNNMLF